MFTHGDTMRVMAEKYLRLAKTTKDATERSRYFDYAMVYAQLSEQAGRREASESVAAGGTERKDVPERGNVADARPRRR
jgi:hypothetical protein